MFRRKGRSCPNEMASPNSVDLLWIAFRDSVVTATKANIEKCWNTRKR